MPPAPGMNAVFPRAKMKAILLDGDSDHSAIGRMSSKAVDLVAACSALLVRDLVDNRHDGNGDGDGDGDGDDSHSHRTTTTSTANASSGAPIKPSPNKLPHPSPSHGDHCTEPAPSSVLTLEDIKKSLHRPEYEFLEEDLDGLTEDNAPNYGAMARKRRRRERTRAGGAREKMTTRHADAVVESMTKSDDAAEGDGGDRRADEALRETIRETLEAERGGSATETAGIVEDDDDYD